MSELHVLASQVRKGQQLQAGCSTQGFRWVRITQREKWNTRRTKVHFEDCGQGLPTAQFGVDHLAMTEVLLDSAQIVVVRK